MIFLGALLFAQAKGRVLNICCWNEEFMSRVVDYYPGYNKSNDTIGKVKVNWILVPSVDNMYQDVLDEALKNRSSVKADDRIDLFLVEPDYALKYLDSDSVMTISDLGITDNDLKNQFKHTKDIGKDSKGNLKALSWIVVPGVFVYRRSIAKNVLGTDDPVKVQNMINTWDKFDAVAKKMDQKNYFMLSGYDDAFRVFYDNMKSPWVIDGKINIDESIKSWVKQTKTYSDEMYNCATNMWSADWFYEMNQDGNVFGYFGPDWFINWVMPHEYESAFGDWAVCKGPQSFTWGGTYICAASGTDNADLIKDILLKMTCDEKVMKKIAVECGDIVNNDNVISYMANSNYGNQFLGDQNPYQYYLESARAIDKSKVTMYDAWLNEVFKAAMKDYFDGKVTEQEAYENFYDMILE